LDTDSELPCGDPVIGFLSPNASPHPYDGQTQDLSIFNVFLAWEDSDGLRTSLPTELIVSETDGKSLYAFYICEKRYVQAYMDRLL